MIEILKGWRRFSLSPPAEDRARFYARRLGPAAAILLAFIWFFPLLFEDTSYVREVTVAALAGLAALGFSGLARTQIRAEASRARKTPMASAAKPADLDSQWDKRLLATRNREEAAQVLPLAGVDLRFANLARLDLHLADLSEALLEETDLHGATLSEADLSRADLKEARLRFANLRGACLVEARLNRADLAFAALAQAVLRQTDLQNASLARADLESADLREARLRFADLRGASLVGARLDWANLEGADLRGANLWATKLKNSRLQGALIDRSTVSPEGVDLRERGAVVAPEH